nr:unnamed protein product [Trichobilharzia regenti]
MQRSSTLDQMKSAINRFSDIITSHLLLIAVIICCIISVIMTISILISRKLRMHYRIYIFSLVLAFLSWTVLVSIFCYQIGPIYSLISLVLTLLAGGTAIFLGFRSREFSAKGYILFYALPMVLFVIGIIFLILFQKYGSPFDILCGLFLGVGTSLIIYLSTVWLKYSPDETIHSVVFTVFLEFIESVGLFMIFAMLFWLKVELSPTSELE